MVYGHGKGVVTVARIAVEKQPAYNANLAVLVVYGKAKRVVVAKIRCQADMVFLVIDGLLSILCPAANPSHEVLQALEKRVVVVIAFDLEAFQGTWESLFGKYQVHGDYASFT